MTRAARALVTLELGHACSLSEKVARFFDSNEHFITPEIKMSFNSTKALEIAKYFIEDIEDPVNLIPVSLALFCFVWSGFPRGKHSALAWWALINGCIIHCWMDGYVPS